MSHLTQEEFVLNYYGEPELGTDRREHLAHCQTCIAELAGLASVLDRVTPVEVPDPGDDYEARVWDRLQWRLRGEKKRDRFKWMKAAAIAATVVIAFLAGLLWSPSRGVVESTNIATNTTTTTPLAGLKTGADSTRILLVVVGEHFDQSERVLVELTNLTPNGKTDISTSRDRAEELVTSNRLYRHTALERGEEDVATLLDELEPVLLQIARSPSNVSAEELRAMQKRVETKGLVFKLRVVRADVHRNAVTSTNIRGFKS
ncbi:MAG TPA: hypothetical protein VGQ36_04415 [Thermoanaerobaculia bacterium]|jgi:hypothetical protein|nr:hypothetical protein [Thermoanaerobaculia bacterium]